MSYSKARKMQAKAFGTTGAVKQAAGAADMADCAASENNGMAIQKVPSLGAVGNAGALGRRGFLKALAFGGVALVGAGTGLTGCAPAKGGGQAQAATIGSSLPQNWDEECEVLVVGSGYAGLSAAYEAAKAGADTMVIEKMAMTGGNSAIADGDFAVCMSSAQAALGIEDSVDKYVADMVAAGLGLNDIEKCRTLASKSNETWEWTRDVLGVEWDADESGKVNVIPYGGHNTLRTLHPKLGHGSAIVAPLLEKLEAEGVKLKTGRMLVRIFRDDSGRVVGVQVNEKAKDNDPTTGSPVYIKAKKAVVLASGGYGRDVAWRSQHDPHLDDSVDCTNQPGATAEALGAAMKAGALAVHLDWIQLGPWCSPDEEGYGKGPSYIDANVAYCPSIDPQTGKRVVNELADRRIYSNAIIENGVPLIQIVDERNIPKWNYDANLEPAIEAGITKKFGSLDEIAAQYQIPADALKETMARYNGFVEAGVDDDFGKKIPKDAKPVAEPPFYVTRIWPKVHHTMGGVKTDANAQVLDIDLKPIPGFYAAGEATGGVHGACRLGSCATADCLVNGRIAGQSAALAEAIA
ncbi:MAG: flavocytochrome c [Coriobacteriaceae bacterium]|jgi:flavocytochrome c|nr:flavocytochrome c [Coriobacteriaceae bacterium]